MSLEEIQRKIDLILEEPFLIDSASDRLTYLFMHIVKKEQEEARDKALELAAEKVAKNSFLCTKEAHIQTIINCKTAIELQF